MHPMRAHVEQIPRPFMVNSCWVLSWTKVVHLHLAPQPVHSWNRPDGFPYLRSWSGGCSHEAREDLSICVFVRSCVVKYVMVGK